VLLQKITPTLIGIGKQQAGGEDHATELRCEVGAFYWTASAPEIVNSGREKQCSVSV
jgi:hypothetical protein